MNIHFKRKNLKMMIEENDIIKLSANINYLVVSKINYKDNIYFISIG